jgi:hypothetical protein
LAVLTHHLLDLPVDFSHQSQDHLEVNGRGRHTHVHWTAQFSCHSNCLQMARNTTRHGFRLMALSCIQDLDRHMHEMQLHCLYNHNFKFQCCQSKISWNYTEIMERSPKD